MDVRNSKISSNINKTLNNIKIKKKTSMIMTITSKLTKMIILFIILSLVHFYNKNMKSCSFFPMINAISTSTINNNINIKR